MFKIKPVVLERLVQDESLQLSLAKAMLKRVSTIKTWIRDRDEVLTSKAVVLVIKDLTGLSEEDIIQEAVAI